jgi:hypothetical protein
VDGLALVAAIFVDRCLRFERRQQLLLFIEHMAGCKQLARQPVVV